MKGLRRFEKEYNMKKESNQNSENDKKNTEPKLANTKTKIRSSFLVVAVFLFSFHLSHMLTLSQFSAAQNRTSFG